MAWVVVLSEEENILFSFDENCLYIDGKRDSKLLKGLPFHVFKYLAECSPNFRSCDKIFEDVWVTQLGKNKPVDDASIRDKISVIRNYLGDTEPYKYIETADGRYRCTKCAAEKNIQAVCGDSKRNGISSLAKRNSDEGNTSLGALDFSRAKDVVHVRRVERANRIMSELKKSMDLLRSSDSIVDFQNARFGIDNAIEKCPEYAEVILESSSDESTDDGVVKDPVEKLKRKLIEFITHYSALIERDQSELSEVDSDLGLIKLDYLLYVQEWHLTVSFLEEAIRREQEGIRLAESQIQKEYLQKTIRNLEWRLDCSRERARTEEIIIDDEIDTYKHKSTKDIASV